MKFIKLPVMVFHPNDELESLGIDYETDDTIQDLNIRKDHIQMYFGDDQQTEVFLTGNDRAHTIELSITEFEKRLNA